MKIASSATTSPCLHPPNPPPRRDSWRCDIPLGGGKEVRIEKPQLPIGIEAINLSDIAAGDARIDLNFERVQQHIIVPLLAMR